MGDHKTNVLLFIFHIFLLIFQDQKLKHMAELQLSVVSDPNSKRQIENQIIQWEENLERLHCEQFRLRCYMASLQNGELPNPKVGSTLMAPRGLVLIIKSWCNVCVCGNDVVDFTRGAVRYQVACAHSHLLKQQLWAKLMHFKWLGHTSFFSENCISLFVATE